jgi:predicted dehydrogenase
MPDRVRWGILGNATIARKCVIPAIQKSGNGFVEVLGSRSPQTAQAVAAEHGIERVAGDYEAVLADSAVDAVYIPLPNHLHRPWTIKALQAGKHVLCEKPLGCSAAQAREMAMTAEKAGLLLMEAFMYRFHPRSRRIKQMVDQGEIGRPLIVRSAFCYRMAEELVEEGGSPRLNAAMGGGALLDVGCYGVSVARWLMDSEPVRVQAFGIYRQGVDVHFMGGMLFGNGALASIEASFISALQQTYTVVGSEGAIELPHDAFIPWEREASFSLRGADQEEARVQKLPPADQYQCMVVHFAEALMGRCSPDWDPADSLRNMRALDALAEAARSGRAMGIEESNGTFRP